MTRSVPAAPQRATLPGLEVVAGPAPRRQRGGSQPLAEQLPIARVLIEQKVTHLDRPMDYLVPQRCDVDAQPGVRVRVMLAGSLRNGYVVQRRQNSDYSGGLLPLSRVISPVPVLTPALAQLVQAVAQRYAGTTAEVLRLAIPPRVARVEAEPLLAPPPALQPPAETAWQPYEGASAWLRRLREGGAARAVWQALPAQPLDTAWQTAFAQALLTTAATGRAALAVLPDARAVEQVHTALRHQDAAAAAVVAVLSADAGPTQRYRQWLHVLRGGGRIVIGTRAAMFAPVANLGLVAIWDDGDALHHEPRAPYPHARDVLLLRAHQEQAAVLVGGFACTPQAALLLESGWAQPLQAAREVLRAACPRIDAVGGTARSDPRPDTEGQPDPEAQSETVPDPSRVGRLPTAAWEAIRQGLHRGPVLVQVPRAGYVPGVVCAGCRQARCCPGCGQRLGLDGGQDEDPGGQFRLDPAALLCPACGWTAQQERDHACPHCAHEGLRAQVSGLQRSAQELGRAFPRVPVVVSGRQQADPQAPAQVVQTVQDTPQVVVATPGAEPVAAGGYAAVVLLDAWVLLGRVSLRAGEQALRRWMAAAALARPRCTAAQPSRVVLVADPGLPTVQALLRWDPLGYAVTGLRECEQTRLPPAARAAVVEGPRTAVQALLDHVQLPHGALVDHLPALPTRAGKLNAAPEFRVMIRVPRSSGSALATALGQARRHWSATAGATAPPPRIHLDPAEVG